MLVGWHNGNRACKITATLEETTDLYCHWICNLTRMMASSCNPSSSSIQRECMSKQWLTPKKSALVILSCVFIANHTADRKNYSITNKLNASNTT